MLTNHPNASAAGLTGAASVLVVYLASLAGLNVPVTAASAFTTLAAALVLYLGRRKPLKK